MHVVSGMNGLYGLFQTPKITVIYTKKLSLQVTETQWSIEILNVRVYAFVYLCLEAALELNYNV